MYDDNKLKAELNNKQRLYKDIFLRAQKALVLKLNTIPEKSEKLDFLNNVVSKDILRKISAIRQAALNVECARCGACCRVATSEFNYEELKEKAQNGDFFAKSFTSTFVPHEPGNVAESEFPDYIALLKERGFFEQTHFYHCPKICVSSVCSPSGRNHSIATSDGEAILPSHPQEQKPLHSCGDYENRPQVCRDFPNNPLVILPPKCSFNAWKDEFEIEALFLNAMIELVGHYTDELNIL